MRALRQMILVCLAASTVGATAASAADATAGQQLTWARQALQRNPQLELLATDERKQVFTVRDKTTGEVFVVALNQLAAIPVNQLASGNVSEERPRGDSSDEATPASANASTPSGDAAKPYTIDRSGGQIRVTGPGISVVSSGPNSATADQSARNRASDPIICEGRRMMQLDSRDIYVDGNAITVRGGCELFITNSHIVATGTGVVVNDGIVHISNSYVEGAQGSFEAGDRAKVIVRGSTFRGLSKRDELAMVQDQGGNRWR
ncbi:MAG TPA: hypothetical protein VFS24_02580 [Steroidobacteraceae bacterium]|nr:hypothetical protein [Steroidobacteraceae bacterium]